MGLKIPCFIIHTRTCAFRLGRGTWSPEIGLEFGGNISLCDQFCAHLFGL